MTVIRIGRTALYNYPAIDCCHRLYPFPLETENGGWVRLNKMLNDENVMTRTCKRTQELKKHNVCATLKQWRHENLTWEEKKKLEQMSELLQNVFRSFFRQNFAKIVSRLAEVGHLLGWKFSKSPLGLAMIHFHGNCLYLSLSCLLSMYLELWLGMRTVDPFFLIFVQVIILSCFNKNARPTNPRRFFALSDSMVKSWP